MSNYIIEVCAGTITDCINAKKAGANRIELVSATYMGGLTPSLGLVKKSLELDIDIIAMTRPRGGGFLYNESELDVIFEDAKLMLDLGVKGLAFGFLNEDHTIDVRNTKKMVELIKTYNAEAVFHRAFDLTPDLDESTKLLIELGITRILTSGGRSNVSEGLNNLNELVNKYHTKVEFLMGSGVNIASLKLLKTNKNIKQYHATFKTWETDPTTTNQYLTYKYDNAGDYEITSIDKIKEFIKELNKWY